MTEKISFVGLGVFGTVVANMIAENSYKVVGYDKYFDENKFKEYNLNKNLVGTKNLQESLKDSEVVVLVTPSFAIAEVIQEIKDLQNIVDFDKNFVVLSKGIDKKSGKFLSELVESAFPDANVAVMYGPNFAQEIADKEITVSTFACKDKKFFEKFEKIIDRPYFTIKYFDDPIAVQLCGLVKNVLAIVCGIATGLHLGQNTLSAIMVRGVEEVERLCKTYGCNANVINTPAGIGDMILTCGSQKSRNMSFGFRIGSEGHTPEIMKSLISAGTTVEGLSNAQNLSDLAKKFNITNSIGDVILNVVNNDYSREQLINVIKNIVVM